MARKEPVELAHEKVSAPSDSGRPRTDDRCFWHGVFHELSEFIDRSSVGTDLRRAEDFRK